MTYRQHAAQVERRRQEHQRLLELLDPMLAAGLSPALPAKRMLEPRQVMQLEREPVAPDKYERTGSAFGPAKRIKES